MQGPKSRNGSSEVSKRISPVSHRSTNSTKLVGSHHESSSSTCQALKATNDRSPSRIVVLERRRGSRPTEVEIEFIKLQEDLKKTRDELSSSVSSRRRAEQEAEEAKDELLVLSAKLEDTRGQLAEVSAAEDARLQELRKISQERDRTWQFELQTLQKQRSVDAAAMASARNEIKRLKLQLEMVLQSEEACEKKSELENSELRETKQKLIEALATAEHLKAQLREAETSEADAETMLTEARRQLKNAQGTIEALLADGSRLMESFSIIATELKESRSRVNSLEELVRRFHGDQSLIHYCSLTGLEWPKKMYHPSADSESELLVSALESTLIKYQEEQIESTVKIHQAFEWIEKLSMEYKVRETELESRSNDAKSELILLKASLFDKEVELRNLSNTNKKLHLAFEEIQTNQIDAELEMKLRQSMSDISELKSRLMEKETTLQVISGENEQLKTELGKELESQEAAMLETKVENDAEKEALVEEYGQREAAVAEELCAAKLMNSEMEAELRRLRVQTEQWRKAAETAAAVLVAGNNGRTSLERMTSFSSDQSSVSIRELTSSLFSDELDDESPKKKKNNLMLKRLSGMWKKEECFPRELAGRAPLMPAKARLMPETRPAEVQVMPGGAAEVGAGLPAVI